ncbi:MAG: SMP-30/gluconolactonase/LRE family protein [Luminiphilus sp.]|nr:SMP-30/gluconolactonase/LRE family protein [Luminiphilus sp.]
MNTSLKRLLGGLGFVVVGWLAWSFIAAPIVPVVWQAPPNPGLTGVFATNQNLANVETVTMPDLGPEDVACSNDGWLYSGLDDGRIVRFNDQGETALFAQTEGRPLGMIFDQQGALIVADAYQGLLTIGRDGKVETLVDQYEGRRLQFVDDVDIAADGTIYFSDASMGFEFHNNLLDFYEGSMTGRLFAYSPQTQSIELLLDGLFFANGVALGPDDAYVLINETGLGRVQRFWLKGPQAGTADVFIEHLPGTPDNINFDGDQTFWIAMPSLRAGVDAVAHRPLVRRLVSVLPKALQEAAATPVSFVLGVNLEGSVVANLQDPALGYNYITSATPCGDRLWLGSLHMMAAGYLPLPKTTH